MIQTVSILFHDGTLLVHRDYGEKPVDPDVLSDFTTMLSDFTSNDIKSIDMDDQTFFIMMDQDENWFFIISADMNEDKDAVETLIQEIQEKFVDSFGDMFLEGEGWREKMSIFRSFEEEIDKKVLLPIKVSIVGYPGVGKTTTLHLICGKKDLSLEYVPTITTDIAAFNGLGNNRQVILWDFSGQMTFQETLWDSLLQGTQIVLLVTDSSYENVKETKKIIEDILLKQDQEILVIAIANKQDLDNRLDAKLVQKILGVPTYTLTAIQSTYREKILTILNQAVAQVDGELKSLEGEGSVKNE